MSKFYITTPLYYVNASPHIGHAYTNVICDCLARFKRMQGNDVFFLTGTDEHGEKIKRAADAEKTDVSSFIDGKVSIFKNLWSKLNISYDFFIRTTDDFHRQAVERAVKTLLDKGDIYKAKYKGFYCMPCESFWTEAQVKEAGGKCPLCKRDVEEIVEDDYFFRLSKYGSWLKKYLEDNPYSIRPRIRYNEVMGFLNNNILEDLCISRPKGRVSWGIDLPIDNNFVVYVWFDALLNYISAAGFGRDDGRFKYLWPADIHFVGKDIIRHHAVFWPIMLKALGLEPPRLIFAHGWWKVGEDKISKSKGNVVDPLRLIEDFGVSAVRYFLLREVPVGMDGNFSRETVINRINSDLANDLGNLVYRTLNMAQKYFSGRIETDKADIPGVFISSLDELSLKYAGCMDDVDFGTALDMIWKFIGVMNKFVEETKPWILWKDKRSSELKWFLFSLLEGIRIAAVYIYPFMPSASESIFEQLGLVSKSEVGLKNVLWGKRMFTVKKKNPLFPRIDI